MANHVGRYSRLAGTSRQVRNHAPTVRSRYRRPRRVEMREQVIRNLALVRVQPVLSLHSHSYPELRQALTAELGASVIYK